jgi:hypothetical protein
MPAQPKDGRHSNRCRSSPPPPLPSYSFEDRIRVEDSRDEPPHVDDHGSRSAGRGPSTSAANLIKLGAPRSRVSQSYTMSKLEHNPHDHYDERNGHDKGRELYNRPAERGLERGFERYEKPAERDEERRQYVYDRPTHHRRERSPARHDTRQSYYHDNNKQRDSQRGRTSSFNRGHRGSAALREEGPRYNDSVIRGMIPRKRWRSFSPDECARPAKCSWDSERDSDRRNLNNELGSRLAPEGFRDGHFGHQNGAYHGRSPSHRYEYFERRHKASPGRRHDHVRDYDVHGSHEHGRSPGLDPHRNDRLPKPFDHHREVLSTGKRHNDVPSLFEGRSDRYTPGKHGGTLRRTNLPFNSQREDEPRRGGHTMDERHEQDSRRDLYDERGGRDFSPRSNNRPLIVRGDLL